jgi:hypothetical protein
MSTRNKQYEQKDGKIFYMKKWRTPEEVEAYKEKLKQGQAKRWSDPKQHEHTRQKSIEYFQKPGSREKTSEATKRGMEEKNCSETLREAWQRPNREERLQKTILNPKSRQRARETSLTEESRERHRAATKIYWSNPENRKKHGDVTSRAQSTPEAKAKRSEISKRIWREATPEFLERMRATKGRKLQRGNLFGDSRPELSFLIQNEEFLKKGPIVSLPSGRRWFVDFEVTENFSCEQGSFKKGDLIEVKGDHYIDKPEMHFFQNITEKVTYAEENGIHIIRSSLIKIEPGIVVAPRVVQKNHV